MEQDQRPAVSPWHVLRQRNFGLLWLGQLISLLGDQVHFIAMSWLVLQLTGSALALGSLLAVTGLPRAVFMLLGGVLTDRFSPRTVMLLSNALRLIVVVVLAWLTLTATIQLWMLYVFAVIFGTVDAFFFPASASIVPQLVETKYLAVANSLVQSVAQLSQLIGPLLAGALLAILATMPAAQIQTQLNDDTVPALSGIGIAFALDALTFLVSIVTLAAIRVTTHPRETAAGTPQGMLASLREGFDVVWQQPSLRTLCLLSGAINFLFVGPFWVGVPLMADERFGGAAAYGLIMGALGGGTLIGTLLAGTLPKPAPRALGSTLLLIIGVMGVGMVGLALSSVLWGAVATAITVGAANGYVNILFITWLQQRTAQAILGRVMSFIFFMSVGTVPLSLALSGALMTNNTPLVLAICGLLLVCLTGWAATIPAVRAMGAPLEQPSS